MATLYEMTEAAKQLYFMLDNEEITEDVVNDTLEGMGADLKLEDYCKVIRQMKADADLIDSEEKRLKKKRQAIENIVKRLNKSVLDFMDATGKKKETTGIFTVRVSESKAVNVTDIEKLPKEFVKETVEVKPDKKAIGALLKAGETVAGAELQINRNIQIK